MIRIYGDTQIRIFKVNTDKYYVKVLIQGYVDKYWEYVLSHYKQVPKSFTAKEIYQQYKIDVLHVPSIMR